jgi:nucleoside-diphosphate-sugar epimerase
MKNSIDVVNADLNHICNNLKTEFSELSGKRVLIAGGAGFLGFYFVQSILHWNKENNSKKPIILTVHDNFMRGEPEWLKNLKGDSNLTVKKHDVLDNLPESKDTFQYIIHAATIASPIYYRKYPIETMDANVKGLRNFLDYCIDKKNEKNSVEGFLFFSTSEIYGDPDSDNIPTSETYRGNVSCTGPRACYDESKRYGETLCVNFAQQYDLPIRIARPFNNYGPGLKISDRRALPDFARNIVNNEDIVLLSDGSPTRTFCYVADAIIGYFKILVNGKNGEAYNIGVSKPEISILELANKSIEISKELFGYQGKLVMKLSDDKEYLTDNPNRRCPVVEKARNDLRYNPTIDIDEGIKRSLLWYSDNQEAEDS